MQPWIVAVAVILVLQTVSAYLSRLVPIASPAFMAEFGWDESWIGYLTAANIVGALFVLFALIGLIQRMGSVLALQAMVRKNCDALLWLMKHLKLFKAQGYDKMIHPAWEDAAQRLAAAFARTWKEHGEFGQFIVPETGEIAVYNSTAGAIAPAGLAIKTTKTG